MKKYTAEFIGTLALALVVFMALLLTPTPQTAHASSPVSQRCPFHIEAKLKSIIKEHLSLFASQNQELGCTIQGNTFEVRLSEWIQSSKGNSYQWYTYLTAASDLSSVEYSDLFEISDVKKLIDLVEDSKLYKSHSNLVVKGRPKDTGYNIGSSQIKVANVFPLNMWATIKGGESIKIKYSEGAGEDKVEHSETISLNSEDIELKSGTIELEPFRSTPKLHSDLKVGMKGPEVLELQKILNRIPYNQIALTGPGSKNNESDYFGELTKAALIKFQQRFGAAYTGIQSELGYVGPNTRANLNTLQHSGSGTLYFSLSDATNTIGKPFPGEGYSHGWYYKDNRISLSLNWGTKPREDYSLQYFNDNLSYVGVQISSIPDLNEGDFFALISKPKLSTQSVHVKEFTSDRILRGTIRTEIGEIVYINRGIRCNKPQMDVGNMNVGIDKDLLPSECKKESVTITSPLEIDFEFKVPAIVVPNH